MTTRIVRWGVLGCARVACKAMIPGIQGSCNARVVALGSRSLDKACTVAADFSIERSYGSYLGVLEDPEVDAVYIPLPTPCTRSGPSGPPSMANRCFATSRWPETPGKLPR